ncbi:MAG: hypothetical protein MJY62_02600 [Bacteroidales bacterium]|nr:hypothetical protein [Bacteroidales bacterium]
MARRIKRTKKFVVKDLGFLYEREGYGWLRRHLLNGRTRRKVRRADVVLVPSEKVGAQVHKYYRVDNIEIDETIS